MSAAPGIRHAGSSGGLSYVDSSAFMKLVVEEPESSALRRHLAAGNGQTSSALLLTEVSRAAIRVSQAHLAHARRLFTEIDLIDVDRSLLERAGDLQPAEVRSLDAIHLATAMALSSDLAEVVTYDGRMADAALQWGMRVVAPA
ncbi:MAG TPA: type II toxin-antitoxin system VapC family toxin [Candidatus Binatia bacterium]|nr:type II toxin-antitoxin system VapC family toxin [Candidatus Binatia bacterium]